MSVCGAGSRHGWHSWRRWAPLQPGQSWGLFQRPPSLPKPNPRAPWKEGGAGRGTGPMPGVCWVSSAWVCGLQLLMDSHHPILRAGGEGPLAEPPAASGVERRWLGQSASLPFISPRMWGGVHGQPGERLALDHVPTLIQSAICKGTSLAAQGKE